MPVKLFSLIVRNLFRSKTRMFTTVLGCTIGAFIVCFFLTVERSLEGMLKTVKSDSNLIITQQDRY